MVEVNKIRQDCNLPARHAIFMSQRGMATLCGRGLNRILSHNSSTLYFYYIDFGLPVHFHCVLQPFDTVGGLDHVFSVNGKKQKSGNQ